MRAGHFESSEVPFSPDELEFYAEEERITIVPKISTNQLGPDGSRGYLHLLSGARCGAWELDWQCECADRRFVSSLRVPQVELLVSFAGVWGKFEPNKRVNVPLWLAVELRKRNQCAIVLPPWMQLSALREVIQAERIDMTTFQPMPFHYVEVWC